jgi:hypothetical protein
MIAADAVSDRVYNDPGPIMGKIGVLSIAAVMLFGLIIPFALYRLRRRIGLTLLLAAALAVGLGYGVLKSEQPWAGHGLAENFGLMLASALVVVAYVGLSVGAAGLLASARAQHPADAGKDQKTPRLSAFALRRLRLGGLAAATRLVASKPNDAPRFDQC